MVQQVLDRGLDRDTFLDWAQTQDATYELVHGQVVGPLTPVTRDHSRVSRRLFLLVSNALDEERYSVSHSDVGVQTAAGIRVADVMVEPADEAGKGRYATSPLFLAEVLSQSSMAIDMIEKAGEYGRLASLHAYAVLSQDAPIGWLWLRDAEVWPDKPAMLDKLDDVIEVPTLELRLPLAEIYKSWARSHHAD